MQVQDQMNHLNIKEQEEQEEQEDRRREVILGDCIEKMKEMPDNIADIIICDPPYNFNKDFGNKSDKQAFPVYLEWCNEWISQCIRLLKDHGSLYIYGFSEKLAFIRVKLYEMNINVKWLVWHYCNRTSPSSKFWQKSHESILLCYKKSPVFNKDDIREEYTEGYKKAAGRTRKETKGRFSKGEVKTLYNVHENGALPRDVIKIPCLSGSYGKNERVDHETQKPLELCTKLIKAAKNKEKNTLLLVPFVGSGSEIIAAYKENIDFIGFEINPEFVDMTNKRLEDTKSIIDKNDKNDNCVSIASENKKSHNKDI